MLGRGNDKDHVPETTEEAMTHAVSSGATRCAFLSYLSAATSFQTKL